MSSVPVAVIVPVYNRPTLVIRTLDSVLSQSVSAQQLIVIDDGSTDDTPARIRAWMAQRATSPVQISLHRQQHAGASHAKNAGVTFAAGASMLAFLDSDDVWPDDFLARTSAALEMVPEALAVSSDQVFDPPDGSIGRRDLRHISARWLLLHGGGVGSCTLFRRGAIEQAGGFEETFLTGEDLTLFLKLSIRGPWAHVAGAPVTMLRGHGLHGAESANLSLRHPDNWAVWATIASRFLKHHAGQSGLTEAERVQLLTLRWSEAARNLVLGECFQQACTAYERALDPIKYLDSLP